MKPLKQQAEKLADRTRMQQERKERYSFFEWHNQIK